MSDVELLERYSRHPWQSEQVIPITRDVSISDVAAPPLMSDAIHVWVTDISQLAKEDIQKLASFVDESELVGIAGLPEVRSSRIINHGLRRLILADYLGRSPSRVAFERSCLTCGASDHGKPRISAPQQPVDSPLFFNISHSGTVVALAISSRCGLGIDVESHDRNANWPLLQDRIFSLSEKRYLADQRNQANVHYGLWTRKEAVGKAIGHGIAIGLSSIDVTPAVGHEAADPTQWQLVQFLFQEQHYSCWVANLDISNSYSLAVAAVDRPSTVDVLTVR